MIISRSTHIAANGIISLFLWLSNIPLCIYTVSSYPFICHWTFRLFPCLDYCKQCCCEDWGACIFSNYHFLWIYAQEWDCRIMWQLYSQFFEEPPYCSPQCLHLFTIPPTVQDFLTGVKEGEEFQHHTSELQCFTFWFHPAQFKVYSTQGKMNLISQLDFFKKRSFSSKT